MTSAPYNSIAPTSAPYTSHTYHSQNMAATRAPYAAPQTAASYRHASTRAPFHEAMPPLTSAPFHAPARTASSFHDGYYPATSAGYSGDLRYQRVPSTSQQYARPLFERDF